MNINNHELTAIPDTWPARRSAAVLSILVGLVVTLVLFGLWPIVGWNAEATDSVTLNLGDLASIIGSTASEAMPKFEESHDFPISYIIALALHYVLWLGFPISFVFALPAQLAAWDLLVDVSMRFLAIVGVGVCTAEAVFRHVVSRAPYRRRAVWVDGPRVLWFAEAVTGASNYLRKLVDDAGRGVQLAPRVNLPRKAEHESMLILGLPGSGKSVIAEGLMYQAIQRGDRLLCVDVKGTLADRITHHFGAEIVNVSGMEPGGGVWAIGQDITNRMTASRIAALLIPESKDPVWSAASRLLLAGLLMLQVQDRGRNWGWGEVKRSISRPVEEIAADLAPTMRQVAEMLRNRDGEPTSMALSTLFNMISHIDDLVEACAALEAQGWPKVSLRSWIAGKTRPVLVLRHDLGNRELSERLLSAMVRSVASDLLSKNVKDNCDHGIWIFADELPRIGAAARDVSELASLGRSRGIRVVASAQSQAQLEEKLSPAAAEALTENFDKIIICKVRPGKSAERIATSMLGTATYAIKGKDGAQTLQKVAALSASEMTRTLGMSIDWLGNKSIRAAVVGLDNIYVMEWKFSEWPSLS